MVELIRNRKRLAFLAGDLAAIFLANVLAVALRFDFDTSAFGIRDYRNLELLVADLILTPLVFYLGGLYQGFWRYAGLNDLIRLLRAVGFRTVGLIVAFYLFSLPGLSRAVLVMSTVLLLLLAGALRLVPRFHSEFFATRRSGSGARTLILGAGDTGESLLRELRKTAHVDFDVVGFIDDDPDKSGLKIHGVPVLGPMARLEGIAVALGVREVIIAIPDASGATRQRIFAVCRRLGVRFKTIPTRGEVARGAARLSQIRPVDVEDLLGRGVVNLDQQVLRQSFSDRRVLVTGAAGSIGRELALQVASYRPEELVVLDRNENNLFYLEADLRSRFPDLTLRVVVGDILDPLRMADLIGSVRPHVLFHAAAYKHVPLMEENPLEAIKNNVLASLQIAEIAETHGVERFLYVSTDKAVRPTSVMGATKRLGERLVKSMPGERTRFMAVRFGNVLGSDGSVIPTFRRQIAAGGPVTVTHPEATRFFMTIPEAVQLVLMAAAMGERGEIFLLRMGEAVRIVDLARNLIELSGLKVGEDIQITFTGLRPGEKLHEELQGEGEEALPTSNDKILILTGINPLDDKGWRRLRVLQQATLEGRVADAVAALQEVVPDYHPLSQSHPGRQTPKARVVEISKRLPILDAQG